MATSYITCPHCHSQNPGTVPNCFNCGTYISVHAPIAGIPQRPPNSPPGQLQAISIVQTVAGGLEILGGAIALVYVLIVGVITFGIGLLFIPIPLIFLVIGILSLVNGINGLKGKHKRGMFMGVGIAQIALILLCDVLSFGAGLASVILLSQPEVKAYLDRHPT